MQIKPEQKTGIHWRILKEIRIGKLLAAKIAYSAKTIRLD